MNKKKLFLFALLVFLSGCSTTKEVFKDVQAEAAPSSLKRLDALECLSGLLEDNRNYYSSGVVIVTDNFYDGSVPKNKDGPLMDQGKLLFNNYLRMALPDTQAVILDQLPLIFQRKNGGKVGVNKFGFVEAKDFKKHNDYTLQKINAKRKLKLFKKKLTSVNYFKIKAAFTRNDGSSISSDSDNKTGKYSKSGDSGRISSTDSLSKKVMGLTLNVVNPYSNSIVESTSYRVSYDTRKKRYKIGAGYNGFSISTAVSESVTESAASAQEELIRAAAVWVSQIVLDTQFYKQTSQCVDQHEKK